jgi:hypothetical protein
MRGLPLTSPVGAAIERVGKKMIQVTKKEGVYTTCLLDLLERFPGDWMWIMRLDLQ